MQKPLPPITVFDIETTGLDPKRGHRIVEIAGVRVHDGKINRELTFDSFVNPERDIPWEAAQVNKITSEDVRAAETIDIVLPKFLAFASGTILVAHNAVFDRSFLHTEKECCWGYVELPECLCTMRLSQSIFPREFRHSLDLVCKRFGIQLSTMRHRALADALVTAEAFLMMIEIGKIGSLDELRQRASIELMRAR